MRRPSLAGLIFLAGILASLTILLAIAGSFGFWIIRISAIEQARKAAESEIKKELPKLLPKYFAANPQIIVEALKNDPSLVRMIVESHNSLYGSMLESTAQNVMTSLEEGVNNGNAG